MKRRELLAAAAAAPLALSGRALAGNAGGTPTALVTADLESHVVALDVTTGRVLRRIRTAPGPRSIENVFMTWAVVAHTALGRVSIVHAPTLRVQRVTSGFAEPRYTAVHPIRTYGNRDQPLAYITDSGRREVVTLDVRRGRVLWRTAVPGPARHIGIDPAGSRLWTALGTKAERVAVLDLDDPLRPRFLSAFATPFLAHDVVCAGAAERAGRVWVTSGEDRRIALYEVDGRRPIAVLPAGAAPQHIAFQGTTAFVASGADGTLHTVEGDTGRVLNRSSIPIGSYNVATAWRGLLTPSLDRGTLTMVDPHGDVRYVRRVARAAHDACLVVAA